MIIRRARTGDMEGINELLLQVCLIHHKGRPDLFKYGAKKYTDEELAAIITDDSRPIFVAVENEEEKSRVLGYAFCIHQQHPDNHVLTDVKTLYIDDLCVHEHSRGRHIGQTLCAHVTEYARRSGCHNVTLNVWSLNASAMRFYEACGFLPQKVGMELLLY